MNRDAALGLQRRGLRDWIANLLGSSSPGARTFERGGITAAVVPSCPQRSIANSVTYDDAAELAAALDELAELYDAAGIAAWTVWVPEFDRAAIEALEGAGHVLDGQPRAMSIELDAFRAVEVGDLDWDNDVDPADLGRLNDLAYGLAEDAGMAAAMASPPPSIRLYQARAGGEPVSVLGTIDHSSQAPHTRRLKGGAPRLTPRRRRGSATPPSDLGFYFVATHPDHRGNGLASRLMTVAVDEGRERGLQTSSLQGSPMGQPIYRRLGYSDDFAVYMYERRG